MNEPSSIARMVKLSQFGDAVGIILPEDVLAKLGAAAGDEIELSETAKGVELAGTRDDDFNRQMMIARRIMDEHRDILRELAK